mgnify:CR=1 FL=1
MHCLETEEFPYYPTDDVWRREEFSKFIQYQANLWDDKIIKQTMHGLALLWSYMPHAFDVQCGKMNTPLQTYLNDKEKIKKKMEMFGSVDSPSGLRKILKVITGTQGVSNFRPTAAQAIYERFMPDGGTTWDMSGGYGGRLLGAIKTHINYIATEPAKETFDGLTQIAKDWKIGFAPANSTEFSQLPGVGPYIAAAVMSIAFSKCIPAIDGNAVRVVSRINEINIPYPKSKKVVTSILRYFIDPLRPGDFNQAISIYNFGLKNSIFFRHFWKSVDKSVEKSGVRNLVRGREQAAPKGRL